MVNNIRLKLAYWGIYLCGLATLGCVEHHWQPIYSGEPSLAFEHYLGIPDSSIELPDLARDSLGNYLEGLGSRDPLEVFTIQQVEGENVICISGQVVGGLILADSVSNYHLRLKFKWGNKKWEWMEGRPKDGGILYHQRPQYRHELQIHEGDVGSYWARKVIFDVPAVYTEQIPDAITQAKPFLLSLVNTLNDSMLIFQPEAPLFHFNGTGGKNDWQIVIANPYNEKAHGEWNTLEVICYKNHAVHMINGEINMVILNAYMLDQGKQVPLTSGRLVLQSEGAVTYFKEIEIKPIDGRPAQLDAYLN